MISLTRAEGLQGCAHCYKPLYLFYFGYLVFYLFDDSEMLLKNVNKRGEFASYCWL